MPWLLIKFNQGLSFDDMQNLVCSLNDVNIKVPK